MRNRWRTPGVAKEGHVRHRPMPGCSCMQCSMFRVEGVDEYKCLMCRNSEPTKWYTILVDEYRTILCTPCAAEELHNIFSVGTPTTNALKRAAWVNGFKAGFDSGRKWSG